MYVTPCIYFMIQLYPYCQTWEYLKQFCGKNLAVKVVAVFDKERFYVEYSKAGLLLFRCEWWVSV